MNERGNQREHSHTLDRALPASIDAEMAVLGAMMLSPTDAAGLALTQLRADSFYKPAHQIIFTALAEGLDAAQATDPVLLTQTLADRGLLDDAGGPVYIVDLLTKTPTAANVEEYVRIVKEKAALRAMIGAGAAMIDDAWQCEDVPGYLDKHQQAVLDLASAHIGHAGLTARQLGARTLGDVEARLLHDDNALLGVASGISRLDKLTNGWQPGQLVVIGARPSVGKTTLLTQFVETAVLGSSPTPTALFSCEMSDGEIFKRMACARACVSLSELNANTLNPELYPVLFAAIDELARAPLHVLDKPGITIMELRAQARRLAAVAGIRLVVVDYLQLVHAPSKRAEANRTVEVADVSAGLKELARELRLPVVVAAQLNRDVEKAGSRKPRLSDLKESGAIEQDADVIGLMHQPNREAGAQQADTQLLIAKQRNGPTGEVDLTLDLPTMRFYQKL